MIFDLLGEALKIFLHVYEIKKEAFEPPPAICKGNLLSLVRTLNIFDKFYHFQTKLLFFLDLFLEFYQFLIIANIDAIQFKKFGDKSEVLNQALLLFLVRILDVRYRVAPPDLPPVFQITIFNL